MPLAAAEHLMDGLLQGGRAMLAEKLNGHAIRCRRQLYPQQQKVSAGPKELLLSASLRTEQLQQFRLRQAGAYQSPRWPAINVNCAAPVVVNSAGPVGNEPARINEIRETLEGWQASLCSMSRRAVGPRRSEPLPP